MCLAAASRLSAKCTTPTRLFLHLVQVLDRRLAAQARRMRLAMNRCTALAGRMPTCMPRGTPRRRLGNSRRRTHLSGRTSSGTHFATRQVQDSNPSDAPTPLHRVTTRPGTRFIIRIAETLPGRGVMKQTLRTSRRKTSTEAAAKMAATTTGTQAADTRRMKSTRPCSATDSP